KLLREARRLFETQGHLLSNGAAPPNEHEALVKTVVRVAPAALGAGDRLLEPTMPGDRIAALGTGREPGTSRHLHGPVVIARFRPAAERARDFPPFRAVRGAVAGLRVGDLVQDR